MSAGVAFPSAAGSEGVFTPTFTFATPGDISNSYTTQTGLYKRVNNIVHIYYRLNVTPTHTTASGAARFGGLPFTINTSFAGGMNVRMIGTQTWPGATGTMLQAVCAGAQTYFELYASKSGGGETVFQHSDLTSGVAVNLAVTGFYFV